MTKRKREDVTKSLDDLPLDIFVDLIEYLESDDVVSLRRVNKNLFRMLNLGTMLTANGFFRFIARTCFNTGLIYPIRNPFPKINFEDQHLVSLYRIKPLDEIQRIVKFFGTDPNLRCGFENTQLNHLNPFLKNFLPLLDNINLISHGHRLMPIHTKIFYFVSSVIHPRNVDNASFSHLIEPIMAYHIYKCETFIGNQSYILDNVCDIIQSISETWISSIRQWCYADSGLIISKSHLQKRILEVCCQDWKMCSSQHSRNDPR